MTCATAEKISSGMPMMAPIGTAVLTGAVGTSGFAHHFDERPGPGVYVCRGTTCFAPTSDLTELRAALWSRVN